MSSNALFNLDRKKPMTKYVKKRRDIKIIVSGDIVELIQYRVPVNCEARDYEVIKGSKNDLEKKEENLQRARSNIRGGRRKTCCRARRRA